MLRLREFLRCPGEKSKLASHVTTTELARAEVEVIKYAQNQVYQSEISSLTNHNVVPTSSPLRKLNPVLNSNGLLVVGGRLKHARVHYESRHPMILPPTHRVSQMIAEECHGAAHLGT